MSLRHGDGELLDAIQTLHHPHMVGDGPDEFSTCVALLLWPTVIWDTNCFYRDFGLDVRASRREIKLRYQTLGGSQSVRFTTIARVLLNDEERRVYDAQPIGTFYVGDPAIQEAFHRKHARAKMDEIVRAHQLGLDADLVAEMYDERVDAEMRARQNQSSRGSRPGWGWAFWQVRSQCDDQFRLSQWRGMLTRAASLLGVVTKIAIGYCDGDGVAVQEHEDRVLVLIGESSTPTPGLAIEALGRTSTMTGI